jgi:hypothetical protein
VDGFHLLEALLDLRLTLVGGEQLGRRQAAVIADERVLFRVPDHAASSRFVCFAGLSAGLYRIRARGINMVFSLLPGNGAGIGERKCQNGF